MKTWRWNNGQIEGLHLVVRAESGKCHAFDEGSDVLHGDEIGVSLSNHSFTAEGRGGTVTARSTQSPRGGSVLEVFEDDTLLFVVVRGAVERGDIPKDTRALLSINSVGFDAINGLECLAQLDLVGTVDLTKLPRLPELRKLTLVNGEFVSLDGIQNAPNVEFVAVRHSPRVKDFGALRECERLRELRVVSCDSVKSLEQLAVNDGLRSLTVAGCEVGMRLDSFPNLKFYSYVAPWPEGVPLPWDEE